MEERRRLLLQTLAHSGRQKQMALQAQTQRFQGLHNKVDAARVQVGLCMNRNSPDTTCVNTYASVMAELGSLQIPSQIVPPGQLLEAPAARSDFVVDIDNTDVVTALRTLGSVV
jgi:hypothetical protein